MNLSAVFHVSDGSYCYPLNENELVIKLKTGKEVQRVELVWGDPFDAGIFGGGKDWSGEPVDMDNCARLQNHKLWRAVVCPQYKRCRYYFILHAPGEVYYYIESGFETKERFMAYKGRRQDFFFPWMNSSDIIRPAQWVNETVWYQIFPDRFCSSGENRTPDCMKWGGPKKKVANHMIFGGDLKGVESRLDYLRDLGITGIYFTPMNEASSNHKYDTTDYTRIDSQFGTNEDMKRLVSEAHKRGIRVMVDGVFNHSGVLFKPWQDVVEKGPESEYFDWFMVNKYPISKRPGKTRRGEYFSFGFADGMPKLNTNNDEVIEYFIGVCRRWIEEYGIDALRLDVANEISHKFCKRLRAALFAIKPDFYICGEIWHDSQAWLRGDEFDSVMNYSLQEHIESFWRNESFTSTDFEYGINDTFNRYAEQTCGVMFNLLDSHDTMRLITRCGGNADAFYQELCALFTLTGSVCIYYGTEVRLEGGYDPDCRRCMPWAELERGDYDDRIEEMKRIIAMRKSIPALRRGKLDFVSSGNSRVIVYERSLDGKTYRVVLNCSGSPYSVGGYKSDVYSRGLSGDLLADGGCAVLETEGAE